MARYIKPNHSTRTPTNILIVDTETRTNDKSSSDNIGIHRLFMGCCKHIRMDGCEIRNQTDYMFWNRKQFWQTVEKCQSEKHPLVIYSHNAGFDATILGYWEMVRRGEIDLKYAVTESPPTILIGFFKGMILRWYDSLNWFRCSVEELGKSQGMPKANMPTDYESKTEWAFYCSRDVDIVANAIVSLYQFVRENDLGVLRPTSGSQSLQTYRHKFSKTQKIFRDSIDKEGNETQEDDVVNIITPHSYEDIIKLERRSYYHADRWIYRIGKVEIDTFPSGFEDSPEWYSTNECSGDAIFRLDVNSLFPYAMYLNKFPIRLFDKSYSCSVRDIVRLSEEYGVIGEVQIDCDNEHYPIKWKGGSIHCTGRYWTTLAGPELLSAISKGHVRCVGLCSFYHMEDIFTSYVRFFNGKRQHYKQIGNVQFAKLCKDMMNSLYGKFAQLSGRWTNADNMDSVIDWCEFTAINPDTEEYDSYRSMNGLVQQYRKDEPADHTFFAIPSYVTAYARQIMKRYINICGERNMYYTYIDSIHCNRNGFDNLKKAGLIHPDDLGKLKIEDVSNYAEYRNIGDYSFGNEVKITGVSKKARQVSENEYRVIEFEKLDTVIQRGGEACIKVSEQTKKLDRRLTCGTVNQDGRTRRLHLVRPIDETRDVLESQGVEETDSAGVSIL